MEWKVFDENCPKDVPLIFAEKDLTDEVGGWYEGVLRQESEYGLCVELFETYTTTKNITHYLIIELPNK